MLVVAWLLVAQILPSIVIANSLFVLYHKLHLLNSYPGLILADASYAVPFSILVCARSCSACRTTSCRPPGWTAPSEWGTFVRVVLPMSRSAIITVALFAFLNGWGDFIFALTLLNGSTFQPITLSIYNYIGVFSSNLGAAMALVRLRHSPRGHDAHRRPTIYRRRPHRRISQGIAAPPRPTGQRPA